MLREAKWFTLGVTASQLRFICLPNLRVQILSFILCLFEFFQNCNNDAESCCHSVNVTCFYFLQGEKEYGFGTKNKIMGFPKEVFLEFDLFNFQDKYFYDI